MRYVFVGQNIIGGWTLRTLIEHESAPELVITRPPKAHENMVANVSVEHVIPTETTANINTDVRLTEMLHEIAPEVILCCGWGNIIKPHLLQLPKRGWINFHPSLLPLYRGSSPIEWQLTFGEEQGGCTSHFMTTRVDGGNIVIQRQIIIQSDDTGGTLRVSCGRVMGQIALESLQILSQTASFLGTPQDESKATRYPPRGLSTSIDWSQTAFSIRNLVRAHSPYPGAIWDSGGREVRVAEVLPTTIRSEQFTPSTIIIDDAERVTVAACDYFLEIVTLCENGSVFPIPSSLKRQIRKRQFSGQ